MLGIQKQETGDSGISLQSARDITYNHTVGMTFSEVRDLFLLLLDQNFPKLREMAAQTAVENIEKFLSIFEVKFQKNFTHIDFDKLKDPDVQFIINEVVETSARKGDKSDLNILSELLIERISNSTSDIISIVSGEAIKIIPKLNSNHINFRLNPQTGLMIKHC